MFLEVDYQLGNFIRRGRMFCQKCGKENSDAAAFCNSCGTNLTKKSTPSAEYLHLKENEVRLLQEKFNRDVSTWPIVIIAVFIGGLVGGLVAFLSGNSIIGIGVAVVFLVVTNSWRTSKSEEAKRTEIELNAAKTELEKMKSA